MKLEAVSLLRDRLAQAGDEVKRERPFCIVSDGDLPGILHARRNGIPSIAVGHGLVFSHAKAPEGYFTTAVASRGLEITSFFGGVRIINWR